MASPPTTRARCSPKSAATVCRCPIGAACHGEDSPRHTPEQRLARAAAQFQHATVRHSRSRHAPDGRPQRRPGPDGFSAPSTKPLGSPDRPKPKAMHGVPQRKFCDSRLSQPQRHPRVSRRGLPTPTTAANGTASCAVGATTPLTLPASALVNPQTGEMLASPQFLSSCGKGRGPTTREQETCVPAATCGTVATHPGAETDRPMVPASTFRSVSPWDVSRPPHW